jgi:pimeloyl-ACP methyl ester carboxylesterase
MTMLIDANGGVIEYEKVGSGPPLLLMHGGEGDLTQWRDVVPLLSDEFTVIPYNQRDTGESVVDDKDYTMEDLGTDAAALIAELGYDRAHVLGSSFGSTVALATVLFHPERVDRLVLCMGGPGGARFEDGKPIMEARDEEATAIVHGTLAGDPEASRKLNTLFFSKAAVERDPRLLDALEDVVRHRSPELTARRMGAYYPWTASGRLGEITNPTLVVAGGDDQILKTNDPWSLATEIRRATLVRFDELGHAWSIEAPQRVVRVVKQFLKEQL